MNRPNLIILYVNDPLASKHFYESLFAQAPTSSFPDFVAFEFDNGISLGLWATRAHDFISDGQGHRFELAFMVEEKAQVNALFKKWTDMGVQIEQYPTEAVFGLTFVAVDPDGHRIRVCLTDD